MTIDNGNLLSTEVKIPKIQAATEMLQAGEKAFIKPELSQQEKNNCVNAVANYLEACANSGLDQIDTSLELSHYDISEKHHFREIDRKIWLQIARVMRDPQSASDLEKVGAMAALSNQSASYKGIYGHDMSNLVARNLFGVYHESLRVLDKTSGSVGTGSLPGVSLP